MYKIMSMEHSGLVYSLTKCFTVGSQEDQFICTVTLYYLLNLGAATAENSCGVN